MQGVPEKTVEDWQEEGYDLRQMSQALATYNGHIEVGGASLDSDEPAGDLGEILAEPELQERFPSDAELVPNVYLYGRNGDRIGEIDYVVRDSDGTVIGIVQVKHTNGDAGGKKGANNQIDENLEDIEEERAVDASDGISIKAFRRNSDDIKGISVGPASHDSWLDRKSEEMDLPKSYWADYDIYIDMSQNEIKTLTDYIDEGNDE